MEIEEFPQGIVVFASFPDEEVLRLVEDRAGPLPLIVADPPYGNIVDDEWDQIDTSDGVFAEWMINWSTRCGELSAPGAAFYVWGGVGKPLFRPFYRFLVEAERRTSYQLANHITWAKKRAYGVSHNFLFTREELAYFVKGDIKKPRMFNIPLLDTKRPYAGYNPNYPAKSEFYRRTNVWTDITELLRGKIHVAEKPVRLHEILIQTHTEVGEWVLDPFAGSGTTGEACIRNGRKFILIENNRTSFDTCVQRLRKVVYRPENEHPED